MREPAGTCADVPTAVISISGKSGEKGVEVTESIQHEGVWWNRKEDGSIHRHDPESNQWVVWNQGDQPSPPESLLAPPPPPGSEAAAAPQVVYVKQQGNGFAVTALVLGVVGLVMGLVPLTGFIAIVCGLLGFIFGLVGRRKGAAEEGSRKGMATAGVVLSTIAFGLGILGFVIVQDAVTEFENDMQQIEDEFNKDMEELERQMDDF